MNMCPEGTLDFDALGADHLTPLAFLDRPIFRIQFAPPVRVSNFVNSVKVYWETKDYHSIALFLFARFPEP